MVALSFGGPQTIIVPAFFGSKESTCALLEVVLPTLRMCALEVQASVPTNLPGLEVGYTWRLLFLLRGQVE